MASPYIGEIRMFGGNFAPAGWMLCQGQTLAISDYDTLFNLIGTTYGGDGQETFQLPDLQSRLPIHMGSSYVLGQTGGVEEVTLTTTQIPSHRHPQTASTGPATSPSPTNGVPSAWADGQFSSGAPGATLAATALAPSGGSQPHENMPPFLCVNFIISLFGIYPSPT